MKRILIANSSESELGELKEVVSREYTVVCLAQQEQHSSNIDDFDLLLLDHNFTENSGIDFLMHVKLFACSGGHTEE